MLSEGEISVKMKLLNIIKVRKVLSEGKINGKSIYSFGVW